MMHSVTIVIPTLNEAHTVPSLLEDLREQTHLPEEIILIDSGSKDGTAEVVRKQFPEVRVLLHDKEPAHKRNMGGYLAKSEIIIFLDADTRLKSKFIEKVIREFSRRKLDVACPWYVPHKSTLVIHGIYGLFNSMFYLLQKILASGAGSCVVVRSSVFQNSRGYDTALKFDDIEFIRRMSWRYSFGILHTTVGVSDRRFKKHGALRMGIMYMVLSIFFTVGAFRAANIVSYEFGTYGNKRRTA